MKKLLFVASGDPFDVGTAGQSVMKAFLLGMNEAGYDVSYLGFSNTKKLNRSVNGISLNFIQYKEKKKSIFSLLFKNLTGVEGWLIDKIQLERFATNHCFDTVVVWEPTQVFWFRKLFLGTQKKVIFSDPVAARISVTLNQQAFKYRLLIFLSRVVEPLFTRWISKFYSEYFIFGSGHSKVFSKILGRRVKSLRPLLFVDQAAFKPLGDVLVVTYGGSFESSATRTSLSNIKKIREALVGRDVRFRFQVLGFGWEKFSDPDIDIVGTVSNFERTLAETSDIFIFPSNYNVGVRTRIAGALTAGNLVICSEAQTYNMPELYEFPGVFFVTEDNFEEVFTYISKISPPKILQLKDENRNLSQKYYSYLNTDSYFGI